MNLTGVLIETDRWSLKPAFVALMMVAVLGLVCRLPDYVSSLLIPPTVMAYGVAALIKSLLF